MQKIIETNKEYHSKKDYISSSGLRMYQRSPEYYAYYLEHGEETNPAFVMGSLYHTAILEDTKLDEEYVLSSNRPDQVHGMTSKANKEWKSSCEAQGRTVVDEVTWNTIQEMKLKLRENPLMNKLMDKGINEESYYIDDFYGAKVKARPDKVTKYAVIDLKSTDNASTEGFTRTMFKYGYHIQAAFYLDILKEFDNTPRQFVFVAQEKKAPYSYQIFRLDDDVIEYGRWQYQDLLEKHKKCMSENRWGGYEQFNELSEAGVTTINLPYYINY